MLHPSCAGHRAADGYNLVPQNANLNLGEWKRMENVWDRALKDGSDVDVRIRPGDAGDGARPHRFDVEYTIDGIPKSKRFYNAPGGEAPP